MTVAPDELTGTEQSVLLVLMAECRPVPNPELKNLGPALDLASRNRLERHGLIEVSPGRPMVLELTDAGWRLCHDLVGADVPARPSGQGRALYTLMRGLRRYLDHADLALSDVFAPADFAPPQPTAVEVTPAVLGDGLEDRVRSAYDRLTRRPGGWVGLAKLREELADVSRGELDAALVRLDRRPGVNLIPEENQKALTDDDRAAAVRIGNENNHLIAIES